MDETPVKPNFRKIFVIEASGHDLTPLKQYTSDIVLLTSGYEELCELPEKIDKIFEQFDPKRDAFVPIGKLASSFLAGISVGKILAKKDWTEIWLGIYRNKDYEFVALKAIVENAT